MALDSDDDLVKNTVEIILSNCEEKDFEDCLGLIANQHYRNSNEIIGNDFPSACSQISYYDFYFGRHLSGDKVLVVKHEYVKKYRFPEFAGERLYPASDVYLSIPGKYKIIRDCIMRKEYLA